MSGVKMRAIAVACSRGELGNAEDRFVLDAFARLGVEARHEVWDDPAVDWGAFDAVIVRHAWDYYLGNRDPFCEWALRVGATTRLFNSPETIWRNTHKWYLKQLEARGVPTIPTLYARTGEPRVDLRDLARQTGWTSGVVKPAIGGSAKGLLVYSDRNIDEAEEHLARLMADEDSAGALVQPLVGSIRTKGEVSLMFVDRVFTHAVRKVPAPDDVRCQQDHGGAVYPHEPGPRELEVARRCNDAWIAETGETPLYARVDLIDMGEEDPPPAPSRRWEGVQEAFPAPMVDPRVVEYEVVEPQMFWRFKPEAADALARATLRRITLK